MPPICGDLVEEGKRLLGLLANLRAARLSAFGDPPALTASHAHHARSTLACLHCLGALKRSGLFQAAGWGGSTPHLQTAEFWTFQTIAHSQNLHRLLLGRLQLE
eukprot:GHVT01053632.1.p1 GENE.GHVT01053632.1~~GHVT01053632.1.p1  ORF type:complete len:104 (+),score=11.74 GHVT01053632.1:87-398(+)